MKLTSLFTASALIAAMTSPMALAATNDTMSDAQKKQVQKVIHDYLVSNPEVLVEASNVLQQRQQMNMQQQAQSAIVKNADKLLDGGVTVAGNPKGTVTLVEFFDYQCGHCKKMAPVVAELIKSNPNLRVVYKEFPIFGKSSDFASRAAIAAAMQGKYLPMHEALIKQDGRLNEQLVMDSAKTAGVDMDKLKTDMNSKTVTDALTATRQLAEEMHLMGTPAFVVIATPNGKMKEGSNPTFIPGAATKEALQELVKKAG